MNIINGEVKERWPVPEESEEHSFSELSHYEQDQIIRGVGAPSRPRKKVDYGGEEELCAGPTLSEVKRRLRALKDQLLDIEQSEFSSDKWRREAMIYRRARIPGWRAALLRNGSVENVERVSTEITRYEAEAAQYLELCIQMEELRDSERQVQTAMSRLDLQKCILANINEALLRRKNSRSFSGSKEYRRGTRTMADSHPRPHRTQAVEENFAAQTRTMMAESHVRHLLRARPHEPEGIPLSASLLQYTFSTTITRTGVR
jgi:hypothetical protein